MIIDGHTHLFGPDPVRYPPAPNTYKPTTDGSVELLKAQMDEAGVDRAVTISPWVYGWDPSYTLDALAENRGWLAAAVLVDPLSPDGPRLLEHFVKDRHACGLRMQGRISKLGPFDDPATTPLWAKAADLGLTVDVNATHAEYPQVEKRFREFPDTPFVLDHCGYISGDLAPAAPTVEPVLRMARYPNVYAKLTFFSLASQAAYPFEDVHWMGRQIIDAFGPERCLWGSNFPKAQYDPKLTYRQSVQLFAEVMDLSDAERGWILGATAAKLWRWG
jgi:L-fuconolactonase